MCMFVCNWERCACVRAREKVSEKERGCVRVIERPRERPTERHVWKKETCYKTFHGNGQVVKIVSNADSG